MEEKQERESDSNSNKLPQQSPQSLKNGDFPTHHPSAPLHEVFDVQTTIDPSYIISLIRKLVPVDEGKGDDVQRLAEFNSSSSKTEIDQFADDPLSLNENGGQNKSNGNIQTSETQPVSLEQCSELAEIDKNDIETHKKSIREEAWEESGCILWDLAADKGHAEFMVQNLVLEVLLANLITSDSVRITEISLGIIGNLACHEVLMNQITTTDKLLETIIDQVFSDDALCLCEVFRVLTLGLQGCQRIVWAKALNSDHILSRMLWIAENTLNPALIEKSVGLFLAIMENQQEVAPILLPTLMTLGLSDLLVNLLASEIGKLTSDRTPERYPALDSILRAIEALSVIDDFSDGICSNEKVVQMAIELIKFPEKMEISSSCVTAVVLMANILVDSPDLTSQLSQDLVLLQSLLDLFPFTSEEIEARNALWGVLAKLLFHIKKQEWSTSTLGELVLMLVNRSDVIEDALLDNEWDKTHEHDIIATSAANLSSRKTAIECVVKMLHKWNSVKDEVSISHNDANTNIGGKNYADDEDVQKLLVCFLKHSS